MCGYTISSLCYRCERESISFAISQSLEKMDGWELLFGYWKFWEKLDTIRLDSQHSQIELVFLISGWPLLLLPNLFVHSRRVSFHCVLEIEKRVHKN